MKNYRYFFAEDCKKDRELMDQIEYFDRLSPSNADPKLIDTKLPFTDIALSTDALSVNGRDYVHAVEADRDGDNIKVRIITKNHRGVNVVIPRANDRILYQKYRDLRFLIRNNDAIYVTFPVLHVMALRKVRGLYLMAYDFKVYSDPDDQDECTNDLMFDDADYEPAKPKLLI